MSKWVRKIALQEIPFIAWVAVWTTFTGITGPPATNQQEVLIVIALSATVLIAGGTLAFLEFEYYRVYPLIGWGLVTLSIEAVLVYQYAVSGWDLSTETIAGYMTATLVALGISGASVGIGAIFRTVGYWFGVLGPDGTPEEQVLSDDLNF